MKVINLDQQSDSWHAWRAGGVGGSDVSCIMGTNPWRSAYDLWCIKTGRKQQDPPNAAMMRGVELEQDARNAHMDDVGMLFYPVCVQDVTYEFMRVSLDGISGDNAILAEYKCPGVANHIKFLGGDIPPYYYDQMQYALGVTGAQEVHFVTYTDESNLQAYGMTLVARDEQRIKDIREKVREFWQCVQTDTPPQIEKSDYVISEDLEANAASHEYLQAERDYKAAKERYEAARTKLLDYTDDGNCIIGSCRLTKCERVGSVSWKKVQSAYGIPDESLEQFRSNPVYYYKISEMKND